MSTSLKEKKQQAMAPTNFSGKHIVP
jgi:hypothetical protein